MSDTGVLDYSRKQFARVTTRLDAIQADIGNLKVRMSALEAEAGHIRVGMAESNSRFDRMDGRVERRLELA